MSRYRDPLTEDEVRTLVRRVQAGESREDVAARLGISAMTVNRHLRLALPPPRLRGADRAWMEHARCAGHPDFTEWTVQAQKSYCNGDHPCPVRKECLAFGLQLDIGWTKANEGPVYGGLSPLELRRLRRQIEERA